MIAETKPIPDSEDIDLEREDRAIPCECGGYADRVDCTPEERDKYGCGRPRDCCSRAFVCRICGTRYAGRAPAPEMD